MDSMPTQRASWKARLIAFGIGIIVAAVVFGIALLVSDDLRLLYLTGALLLAVAAFLLGSGEDWIAAVLLLFASTFLFAFFVLPQTPLLWPTLLLWAAIVTTTRHLSAGRTARSVSTTSTAVCGFRMLMAQTSGSFLPRRPTMFGPFGRLMASGWRS